VCVIHVSCDPSVCGHLRLNEIKIKCGVALNSSLGWDTSSNGSLRLREFM
jgi:hypothetical protein